MTTKKKEKKILGTYVSMVYEHTYCNTYIPKYELHSVKKSVHVNIKKRKQNPQNEWEEGGITRERKLKENKKKEKERNKVTQQRTTARGEAQTKSRVDKVAVCWYDQSSYMYVQLIDRQKDDAKRPNGRQSTKRADKELKTKTKTSSPTYHMYAPETSPFVQLVGQGRHKGQKARK